MDRNDLRILRKATLFHDLSDEALRRLAGNRSPRLYPKGAILFQQGDKADRFYAILQGWVKLYRQTATGEESIIDIFSEGETIAEAAMFDSGLFPASAEVVEDARLLAFDGKSFLKHISEDPSIAIGMLASTSRHLRSLVEEVEQIKGRSAVQRLALFILKLCPARHGPAEITLPYEKSLIAARLGMQPESLSRALAKLRAIGVTTVNERLIVADPLRLAEYAEAEEDLHPAP